MRIIPSTVGRDIVTDFDDNIEWTVHTLCSELALWMFDDDAIPGPTSLVGLLSSSAFERLILETKCGAISTPLRLFLELSSVLYCSNGQSSYAGCSPCELWEFQASMGSKVLRSLDAALGAPTLMASSLDDLKALFLVVLATIIAVGYSKSWRYSGDVSLPRWTSSIL